MDKTIRTHLDNIRSKDGQLQNRAYHTLIEMTEKPVDRAYEVWDELIETEKDLKYRKKHATVWKKTEVSRNIKGAS